MKRELSLLTVPLHFKERKEGLKGIKDGSEFAKAAGYADIDCAMIPNVSGRDFSAETVVADDVIGRPTFYAEGVAQIRESTGIKISAVTYCTNPLGNAEDRKQAEKVIKAGKILGAETAIIFIGNLWNELSDRGITRAADQQAYFLNALDERIKPLVELGGDAIEVGAETCPMWNDQRNGLLRADVVKNGCDNWFHDREMWRMTLGKVPGLKMVYDLSHRANYITPAPDEKTGFQHRMDVIIGDVKEFGKYFAKTNHLKEGVDVPQSLDDLTSAGSVFVDNTHMRNLTLARAPHAGRLGKKGIGAYLSALDTYAPQVKYDTVELEDASATCRGDNERLFKETAAFYKSLRV